MQESVSFEIIPVSRPDEWNAAVKRCCNYDFCHFADYHATEDTTEPFLFVYHRGADLIILPLLKRVIKGTPYLDCTTVYGYTGPASNIDFAEMDSGLKKGFTENLHTYLYEGQIVAVFCRMHPLYDQKTVLKDMPEIYENGKSVAIDLQQPVELQRLGYRKAIRQKINQLRRRGFEVKAAVTHAERNEFIKIYTAGMDKVAASAIYYFDERYFDNLLGSENIDSVLLLCYFEGQITAGAIVTFANRVMQVHLAGTAAGFLSDSPMKLIFDEASLLGRNRNMHYLHIGSGVGGQEDSLFHFKTGFSNLLFPMYTWRYIVNKSVYNQLIDGHDVSTQYNTNLFPLYRFL